MEGFVLSIVCKRCGNDDLAKFGRNKNGELYCRACISFMGEEVIKKNSRPNKAPIHLSFKLSKEQKKLSRELISNYQKGFDSLAYAVCGSGKTEISYGLISYVLTHGGKVGFALPRREVALEIYCRLKEVFSDNSITLVYGGSTNKLEADIIVLTTHQLFRYKNYFALLILDEIDAFPYKDSEVLHGFFNNAISGHHVLMTATPNKKLLKEYQKKGKKILELRTRYHKHPIPVPSIKLGPKIYQIFYTMKMIKKFSKERKPIFIFAPTISESIELAGILKIFHKKGNFINSKSENRKELISSLKDGRIDYLVTTSVLERGVTVKELQVIIFHADYEEIYDVSSLIQIAGRVGRKKEAPDGMVLFLANKKTSAMEGAIKEIEASNEYL